MKTLTIILFIKGLFTWLFRSKKQTIPEPVVEPPTITKSVLVMESIEIKPNPVIIEEPLEIKIETSMNNQLNIKEVLLPKEQYMGKRIKPISIIALHFTEGSTPDGTISFWKETKDKVGTNYIIDKDGTIYRIIPEDCWAYQFGIRFRSNGIEDKYKTKEWSDNIEQMAIGIEMVNEGSVIKRPNGYYFEGGNRYIENSKVVRLSSPHRGYFDYVDFTDTQCKSLRLLILDLAEKYDIPLDYTEPFSINKNALNGIKGVYSHCSVRTDKQDVAPLPKLINLLKNLK